MKELSEAIIKTTKAVRALSVAIRKSGFEVNEFRLPRKQKKRLMKAIKSY